MRWLPAFAGRPDFGKVAVDGLWEEAITFLPGGVPDVRGGNVACEAFWGKAFFGLRTPEVARFSAAMTQPDFFAAIEREFGLGGEFAFAEIGAEGAWLSVGAFRVERALDWAALEASPVWLDTTHDKALEFSFDGGRYWFALPLGRVLDRDRVEEALGALRNL